MLLFQPLNSHLFLRFLSPLFLPSSKAFSPPRFPFFSIVKKVRSFLHSATGVPNYIVLGTFFVRGELSQDPSLPFDRRTFLPPSLRARWFLLRQPLDFYPTSYFFGSVTAPSDSDHQSTPDWFTVTLSFSSCDTPSYLRTQSL